MLCDLNQAIEQPLERTELIPEGGGGKAAGASLAVTVSSVCATRLVSENVGRRVVKGTERTRGSPLSSGGASPWNRGAALAEGACTKTSAHSRSCGAQARMVSWMSLVKAAWISVTGFLTERNCLATVLSVACMPEGSVSLRMLMCAL